MEACDLVMEAREFDETKTGVKGLLDSGIFKIPKFFIHARENLPKASDIGNSQFEVPVIDLQGVNGDRRMEIVDRIRRASETWGFFQVVNHGVPINILEEMIEGVRRFHEQPKELKMDFYSSDGLQRTFTYYSISGGRIDEPTAWNWKDSIAFNIRGDQEGLNSHEVPSVFRDIALEYLKCISAVKDALSELLSEALGLNRDHLKRMECLEPQLLVGHYYPVCPEPNLTLGIGKHSDPDFLTILLQDRIGGLQVLHENQWVDVVPVKGALVVNIGDLLQLITNDRFLSVEHRVLAGSNGPRISVPCFFNPSMTKISEPFGPLEELTSDDNPPKYRKTLFNDYFTSYAPKGLDLVKK